MEHETWSYVKSNWIITKKWFLLRMLNYKKSERERSQDGLQTTNVIALYSALTEEREIICFFFFNFQAKNWVTKK